MCDTDRNLLATFAVDYLVKRLGVRIYMGQITSWHHLDALLAFLSGLRYLEQQSQEYGVPEEGIAVV